MSKAIHHGKAMQLGGQAFRQTPFDRLTLLGRVHRRLPRALFVSPPYPRGSSVADGGPLLQRSTRFVSSASARGPFWVSEPDSVNDTLRTPAGDGHSGRPEKHRPPEAPTRRDLPDSKSFGKWSGLAWDEARLEREADFDCNNTPYVRLVDRHGNSTDVALWACLLNFAHRKDGDTGVRKIWKAVQSRRTALGVDEPLSGYFWNTILDSALGHSFLESTYIYAEWMIEAHQLRWPDLYNRVMSFYLQNGEYGQVLRWHIRLSPRLGPSQMEFEALLQQFATNDDPGVQTTLQSLYVTSSHRQLYDVLVPFLFASGNSALAMSWSLLFRRHGDLPKHATASRPFLRFLAGYIPSILLSEPERRVQNLNYDIKFLVPGTPQFRETTNRVHGEMFGLREQPYSDTLGARWFASSWATLDFAISAIHALGVREIGPLSLQSICLREPNARGVAYRLDQLEAHQIGIGHSAYALALQHFAQQGHDLYLQDLLHSDLHPDVFDDAAAQQRILEEPVGPGEWKRHRVLLAVRLTLAKSAAQSAANALLQTYQRTGLTDQALKLLDNMIAIGTKVTPTGAQAISLLPLRALPNSASPGPGSLKDLDQAMLVYRKARAAGVALPSLTLRAIISGFGSRGHISDMEDFCLELVDSYQPTATENDLMVPIHWSDVPGVLASGGLHKIPGDLPLNNASHPLSKIFTRDLQVEIVRCALDCSLRKVGDERDSSLNADGEAAEHVAPTCGVELLKSLERKGVSIHEKYVQRELGSHLARLHGRDEGSIGRRTLVLEDVTRLLQLAWNK
jgi:hypothetical protein